MSSDNWKSVRAAGEVSPGTAFVAYPEPASSVTRTGYISAGEKQQ